MPAEIGDEARIPNGSTGSARGTQSVSLLEAEESSSSAPVVSTTGAATEAVLFVRALRLRLWVCCCEFALRDGWEEPPGAAASSL